MGEEEQSAARDQPCADALERSPHVYEVHDRTFGGYGGKWRYRVTEYAASPGFRRAGFKLLFKRRADASSFAQRCSAFSVDRALRVMSDAGLRVGVDFKIERPMTNEAASAAHAAQIVGSSSRDASKPNQEAT